MSYENAPATELLSTACACCARPLVDALSVECGVGPICRQKYGYSDESGTPDVAGALTTLAMAGLIVEHASWEALEVRDFANRLIHRFARLDAGPQSGPARIAYAKAIGELGYVTLAAKLVLGAVRNPVRVTADASTLVVKAPFCEAFNAARRAIPGATFDMAAKVHRVPAVARVRLWEAIVQCFPKGTVVTGPRGVMTL